jgi:hypothetical protein
MAGDGQFVVVHKKLQTTAELVGPFVDRPYTASNGDTYRYFFGSYTGAFTQERITREADDLLAQLRKSGKSVETFPNGSAKDNPNRRYIVAYGDVMIVGWSNETRGSRGWMAVHNNDRDNRVTPQLQVLSSTGERHTLRGIPGDPNQSCLTTWRDGQDFRDRQMFLIEASTDVVRIYFPN